MSGKEKKKSVGAETTVAPGSLTPLRPAAVPYSPFFPISLEPEATQVHNIYHLKFYSLPKLSPPVVTSRLICECESSDGSRGKALDNPGARFGMSPVRLRDLFTIPSHPSYVDFCRARPSEAFDLSLSACFGADLLGEKVCQ